MSTNFGIHDIIGADLIHREGSIGAEGLMLGSLGSGHSPERDHDFVVEGNDAARPWRITQPLPRPGKFKGVGPKRFDRFKIQFEAYAASMWGDDKQGWKVGLESLLEGYPLALYQSYMEQGLTYDEIAGKLAVIFKGETDPFLCRKLLKLKLLKRGGDEPWVVFLSRISNLLCEIYPGISEEDRDVRTREVLLQKFDNKTAEKVVNMCMLRSDFSPRAVFESVKALDSIPPEITEQGDEAEEVNLANYGTKRGETKQFFDNQKHCLYCGDRSHYMADCPKYLRLCNRCSTLEWGTGEDANTNKQGSNPNYNGANGNSRGNYDRNMGERGSGPGPNIPRNNYPNNPSNYRDQNGGRNYGGYNNWNRGSERGSDWDRGPRRDSERDQYPRRNMDWNRGSGSGYYNGDQGGQTSNNYQSQRGQWGWDQGRRGSNSYEAGGSHNWGNNRGQGSNYGYRQGN